jgi:hypothetical protein
MFKLGLTQQQDCQLYGDKKEDSVHIVCHCPALACKRYRTLGHIMYVIVQHWHAKDTERWAIYFRAQEPRKQEG